MNPIPKPDFTNIHLVTICIDDTPKVNQPLIDISGENDSEEI